LKKKAPAREPHRRDSRKSPGEDHRGGSACCFAEAVMRRQIGEDEPFGRAQRSVHQSKRACEQGGWQRGPGARWFCLGGRDVSETAKGGPTGEKRKSGPTRELFGPRNSASAQAQIYGFFSFLFCIFFSIFFFKSHSNSNTCLELQIS
jgi:hypothetical protein